MKLIYITGISGAGKSTVCSELKRRGYAAYDTDKDDIAFFYNNETGEAVTGSVSSADRTVEWRKHHTFKAKRETIEKLRHDKKPVFICGVTSNDADELWDLFDKVFALVIDGKGVLHERVVKRCGDGYGKNEHELAELLQWQRTATEDYKKLGAELIDASRPVGEVVDDIVSRVADSSSRPNSL